MFDNKGYHVPILIIRIIVDTNLNSTECEPFHININLNQCQVLPNIVGKATFYEIFFFLLKKFITFYKYQWNSV